MTGQRSRHHFEAPTVTCPVTRKLGFASRHTACAFIRQRVGSGGENFTARWEYACSHCGKWHITSSPPRQQAA